MHTYVHTYIPLFPKILYHIFFIIYVLAASLANIQAWPSAVARSGAVGMG